jgi:hypothetical protein
MADVAAGHMQAGRFLLAEDATAHATTMAERHYVCDICARCGAAKERNDA